MPYQAESLAPVVHFIAMRQKETFTQQVDGERLPVNHRPDFFRQVVEPPDIMVSDEDMNFHAVVL